MPEAALLLTRVAVLESKLEAHEKLHSEFMLRTDTRLETLISAIAILTTQSAEWGGVRKTLTVLITIVTLMGGALGWATREFGLHLYTRP